MVDIKFIAKVSGVSIATVSRVLNHSKPVSRELEERVMKNVQKYNYHPYSIAQQLLKKKTHLIGVVLENISNPFQASLLEQIETQAMNRGYHIIVVSTYGENEKFRQALSIMQERYVDGVISFIYGEAQVQQILQKDFEIPIVFPTSNDRRGKSRDLMLTVDDFQAGYDVAEYLISLGHKSFGCFCSLGSKLENRKIGFQKAIERHYIPLNEQYFIKANSEEEILAKVQMKIHASDFPTAWFCFHDLLTMRFMLMLMREGIRVPEDVSLVGFDDIPLAEEIGLTTIRQPVEKMAKRELDILISMIEHKEMEEKFFQELPHELVIRNSTSKRKEGNFI